MRTARRGDSLCIERRKLFLEPMPQPPVRVVRFVRLTRRATVCFEARSPVAAHPEDDERCAAQ
jgi:hypothetical protein